MISSRARLRTLVTRLGLSIAITTFVLIPTAYFLISYQGMKYELQFAAKLKANRLAKYIYSHQELWQYQTARLAELIEVPEAGETGTQQKIFDKMGNFVTETGVNPEFPMLTMTAPITVRGSNAGRIETVATLLWVWIGTGVSALLSGLLGFAIFFALRILPLRIIDRTLDELKSQTDLFETSLDNMSQGLCMFDADKRLLVSNQRYCQLFGIPSSKIAPGMTEAELIGVSASANLGAGTVAKIDDAGLEKDGVLRRANGNLISVLRHEMANGGEVVTYEDITERRAAEGKIFHMARHDPLTNLPNRRLFHEELEHALSHAEPGDSIAVLYLDIDNFKAVNDTLGHPVGDELLLAITQRLRDSVRVVDTVARLGGDEFAIVQTRGTQPSDSAKLAIRLVEAIGVPFQIDGHHVTVGTSIGIALSPNDGTEPSQLLKNADMALYRAKADGRGTHRYFEAEMDASAKRRRALEMDLRRALAMDEFELFYQPIVNIASEQIVGFEGLLRWNHPERGLIMPDDFIKTAEETNQIVQIGEWVIRKACNEAVNWPDRVKVAINLSPIQLRSANLMPVVKAALAASGLAPSRLELEITESVMLHDNDRTTSVLNNLHALGIRISMDDFGTGYSSLSHLRKFPFDKIKIDRSFIQEMSDRSDSLAIIKAVSAIGVSLQMLTTAEGVETQEQLERVKDEGCTEAQGYLFSRPVPASQLARLLRTPLLAHPSDPGDKLRSDRLDEEAAS